MPARDNTGPHGEGSMTGRRMGECASKNNENNTFPRRGNIFGRRRGRGFGLGRRERFFSDNKSSESSTEETIDSLSQKINSLQNALTSLKNKIEH